MLASTATSMTTTSKFEKMSGKNITLRFKGALKAMSGVLTLS